MNRRPDEGYLISMCPCVCVLNSKYRLINSMKVGISLLGEISAVN